jgi:hypothetical protein
MGGAAMNANKWVAVLAAGSVLAVAAPLSAQFGGLKSLKKAMDTVAKELEKPKPAPQPQPTARPTPPQSNLPTEQGGYASPTPIRTRAPVNRPEQVVIPATPPALPTSGNVQNSNAQIVLATEIFRCRGESDGTPRKLELEYLQSRAGVRSGRFTETTKFPEEGEIKTQIDRGTFRFSGADYDLSYRNPEIGSVKLQVSSLDPENGWVARTTKYDPEYSQLDNARTLTEYISPQRAADSEEAGGDTNALFCELVKPTFASESFEDYSVDDPDLSPERYDTEPALPQFAGRDVGFRNVRTMLTEAVKDHWSQPKFGKFHLAVLRGKWGGMYGYLVDMRSGKVSLFFEEFIDDGMIIDYSFRDNSNLLLSITANNEKDYCHLNYSKLQNNELVKIKHEVIGTYKTCLNEYGTSVKDGYINDIEIEKIGG